MKKKFTVLILIIIGLAIANVIPFLLGQFQEKDVSNFAPLSRERQKYFKQCLKNFDINKITSEEFKSCPQEITNYFVEYINCQVALRRDPQNECQKLEEVDISHVKACEDLFYFFPNFLARIIKNKKCGEEEISACVQALGANNGKGLEFWCPKFCSAILEKDPSLCYSQPDLTFRATCLAMLSQNKERCQVIKNLDDRFYCEAKSLYYQALINRDKAKCNQIKHPAAKAVCNLFFKTFPSYYCQELLEKFKKGYCYIKAIEKTCK